MYKKLIYKTKIEKKNPNSTLGGLGSIARCQRRNSQAETWKRMGYLRKRMRKSAQGKGLASRESGIFGEI